MYATQLLAQRSDYMRRARNAAYMRDLSPARHFLDWQATTRALVAAARQANRLAVARMREWRTYN